MQIQDNFLSSFKKDKLYFFQNPKNYCRDPDCPEGCDLDHGECNQPNVCTCKVGYYGQACQVKYF